MGTSQLRQSLRTSLVFVAGNCFYSVVLLQHPNIDISIKDSEGNTPFDLYNSTLSTICGISHTGRGLLYVWKHRGFVLTLEASLLPINVL